MHKAVLAIFLTIGATRGAVAAAQTTTGDGEKTTRQAGDSNEVPLAPEKYRRPAGWKPHAVYPKSLAELSAEHSRQWIERADREMKRVEATIAKGPYKAEGSSLDGHRCPEWFLDAKIGIMVDWNLCSIPSWSPYRQRNAMYPDWYEKRAYVTDWPTNSPFFGWYDYHLKNWGADFRRDHFIELFTAAKFNARALCRFFRDCGFRYVVPQVKHHSGFCQWDSSWTFRNTVCRGPGRNFAAEYRRACDETGLKFGFYFSLGEWEYPMLKEDGSIEMYMEASRREPWSPEMELVSSGKVAVRDYLREYSIPQAVEFIDKYDPDILWYDYDWTQLAEKLGGYEISAYFYNVNEGRKDVCVNDRYGRERPERMVGRIPKGKPAKYRSLRLVRGDFYTDEFGDNDAAINPDTYHPWESCRGISPAYGNHWQDNDSTVLSARELVVTIVDTVARGGNFVLIVNLDREGDIPALQRQRLESVGLWIRENGEAIYGTRLLAPFRTKAVDYTRAKDGRAFYAIVKEPSKTVVLDCNVPSETVAVHVASGRILQIRRSEGRSLLELPEDLRDSSMPFAVRLAR